MIQSLPELIVDSSRTDSVDNSAKKWANGYYCRS